MKYNGHTRSNDSHENTIRYRVGQNVRNLRVSLGLTLKDFGTPIGLEESRLSLLERGQRPIDITLIVEIIKAYKVSFEKLIEGALDHEPQATSSDVRHR